MKKMGPITEPWGTPRQSGAEDEADSELSVV